MDTRNKKVPLSQTQLGMYFESVRMGEGAYNRHYLYTLDKSLDMERLAKAIEKTVQAHPYMEVRISQDNSGAITQSIPESKSQYHQTVERMTEAQWRERLKTLTSEPLTLNGGRLFRFDLAETECGKYMLRTTHHIAFDGVAHNVMMSDIAAAYNGESLTQETYNALDVVEEESKLRESEEYQRAKEWYVKNFSGLDVVSLPPADNSGNNAGECFVYQFDFSEDDMKKFCGERNISTLAFTSGAFAILTGFYTNQKESLFSTIYHGRTRHGAAQRISKNTAHLIGMFVKTLPVYAKWDSDTRVSDFLMSLSEQIQGAKDNNIFSFADVNTICPMNDTPMFAWHGTIRTHAEVCGMPASEELLEKKKDDTALSVELMSVPFGMSLRVEYDSGKYTREFIETLAESYGNILCQLMTKEFLREIEPCQQGTKAGNFNDTGYLEGANDFPVLDDYPLTKIQEGIFFETQSHPGTTIYNITTLLELAGTPDISRIKDAIVSAVKAHPYLLTRFFLNEKGEIRQKRPENFAFDVEESRFRNLDELKKNLLRPYDLLNDRLIRANIARTDDGKIYVYLDMNHAVFDGMSQQIFMRDIERAYNGETLEPEKFSGFEAALLEERLRNSPQYQKAKDYYTELFKDCDSDCLPFPDMQENAQGSLSMILSGHADAEAIRKFCDDNGISENDFYTAAFGYIIAGFNGRGDAIFTTINDGRNDSRFMDSVSMFVRTYPVICKTAKGTVLDYIRETKRQLTESLSYGAYSFAEINHDLGITDDILFAFHGAVSGKTELFCGCPCSEVNMSLDEAKAGIEMLVFPENGGLSYHFTCRKNLYTEDFIRNFAGVYDNVLTEFTRKKNLNDAEFLDAEAESLLDNANDNATDYDKSDIVTQFRKAAEKFPDNIAVVYGERRYTYREVDEITERIAAYLKRRGIGAEDVVSVLIPRCEYIALASLGVLKSCAAYQPLDPTYPPERLEFMIKDASAKLLIADRNLINDCVPNYNGDILYTDEIPSLPHAEKLTETPKPSNLFIMLYTSGSTGVPKGVMLEHGNLACFLAWDRKANHLTEKSRAAQYAGYGFDMHMMGIYPPLTSGVAVYIIGEEMRLDFESLQKYIAVCGILHGAVAEISLCRR